MLLINAAVGHNEIINCLSEIEGLKIVEENKMHIIIDTNYDMQYIKNKLKENTITSTIFFSIKEYDD